MTICPDSMAVVHNLWTTEISDPELDSLPNWDLMWITYWIVDNLWIICGLIILGVEGSASLAISSE